MHVKPLARSLAPHARSARLERPYPTLLGGGGGASRGRRSGGTPVLLSLAPIRTPILWCCRCRCRCRHSSDRAQPTPETTTAVSEESSGTAESSRNLSNLRSNSADKPQSSSSRRRLSRFRREPRREIPHSVNASDPTGTPSVSNVHAVGDIVEDNTIKGNGKYFGGKEGLSKFQWFREKENESLNHLDWLSFQLPVDPLTGLCKGFGFVQFARLEDAKAAQSLNGQLDIAGKVIKVSAVTMWECKPVGQRQVISMMTKVEAWH